MRSTHIHYDYSTQTFICVYSNNSWPWHLYLLHHELQHVSNYIRNLFFLEKVRSFRKKENEIQIVDIRHKKQKWNMKIEFGSKYEATKAFHEKWKKKKTPKSKSNGKTNETRHELRWKIYQLYLCKTIYRYFVCQNFVLFSLCTYQCRLHPLDIWLIFYFSIMLDCLHRLYHHLRNIINVYEYEFMRCSHSPSSIAQR